MSIILIFIIVALAGASDLILMLGAFTSPNEFDFLVAHGDTPGNPLLLTTAVGSVANVKYIAIFGHEAVLASRDTDGYHIQSAVVNLDEKTIYLSNSALITGLLYGCEFSGFAFSGELAFALAFVEDDFFRNVTIYSIDVASGTADLLLNEAIEEFDFPSGFVCSLFDNFLLQQWEDQIGFILHGRLYNFSLKSKELISDRLKLDNARLPIFDIKNDLVRYYSDEGTKRVVYARISNGKILYSLDIEDYLIEGFAYKPSSQISTSSSFGFFVERTLSNYRLSGITVSGLFFCSERKTCATIPLPSSYSSLLVASDYSLTPYI